MIQRVTLSASDDKYAPPLKEIDLSVIGNDVYISVYEGSLEDTAKGRKLEYEVPQIALHDLIAAVNAFGDVTRAIRVVRDEAPGSAV